MSMKKHVLGILSLAQISDSQSHTGRCLLLLTNQYHIYERGIFIPILAPADFPAALISLYSVGLFVSEYLVVT